MRIGAAEALWLLGEKDALTVLETALAEAPEDWQRVEAVAALKRMGAGDAALRKALQDPAFAVREAARTAVEGERGSAPVGGT